MQYPNSAVFRHKEDVELTLCGGANVLFDQDQQGCTGMLATCTLAMMRHGV